MKWNKILFIGWEWQMESLTASGSDFYSSKARQIAETNFDEKAKLAKIYWKEISRRTQLQSSLNHFL